MAVLQQRPPQGKSVLSEEALTNKFFQIFSKVSTVDGIVSLIIVVRTVFFRSEERRVVLDQLRLLYLQLVLNGIEDFVDRESQHSEVLFHLEGLG